MPQTTVAERGAGESSEATTQPAGDDEPFMIRIAVHGKMQNYIKFALQFLQVGKPVSSGNVSYQTRTAFVFRKMKIVHLFYILFQYPQLGQNRWQSNRRKRTRTRKMGSLPMLVYRIPPRRGPHAFLLALFTSRG